MTVSLRLQVYCPCPGARRPLRWGLCAGALPTKPHQANKDEAPTARPCPPPEEPLQGGPSLCSREMSREPTQEETVLTELQQGLPAQPAVRCGVGTSCDTGESRRDVTRLDTERKHKGELAQMHKHGAVPAASRALARALRCPTLRTEEDSECLVPPSTLTPEPLVLPSPSPMPVSIDSNPTSSAKV